MSDTPTLDRRRVLQGIGTTGALSLVPSAGAEPIQLEGIEGKRLDEISINTAPNEAKNCVAFTTITEHDGYQLYLAEGVDSASAKMNDSVYVTQVSNAKAGVHGPHWVDENTLRFSQDNQTITREWFDLLGYTLFERNKEVRDAPLPFTDPAKSERKVQPAFSIGDIPYPIDKKPGNPVVCTDIPWVTDWCLRIDANTGHSPVCKRHNPPDMPHVHLLDLFRTGEPNSGVNVWTGYDGNCIWIGEENYSKQCAKFCKDLSGDVGTVIGALREFFEDNLEKILLAAGISASAVVLKALAYYLAGSTLAPPTGVPGV